MTPPAIPYINELTGVSCATADMCIAVGANNLLEEWDGTSWTTVALPTDPGGVGNLNAVSCSSSTFCMAVGTVGAGPSYPQTFRFDGTSWTELPVPPSGQVL